MRCGNSFLGDLVYTACIDCCHFCVYVFRMAAAWCYRRNTLTCACIAVSLYLPARAFLPWAAFQLGASGPLPLGDRAPSAPAAGNGAIKAAAVDERWLSLHHHGLEGFVGGGLALAADPARQLWDQQLEVGAAVGGAIQAGIDRQRAELA